MSLISVVIPTLNRKAYLKKAIQSVQNQTHKPIQIIVVDGNSSDGTRDYLRSLNQSNIDLVLNDEPHGQSKARNKGIAEAKGDFILFLDDDDVLLSEAVEKMLESIKSFPDECAGVFASEKRFGKNNGVHKVLTGKVRDTYNLDFGTSCSMFRHDLLDEVGCFDESLRSSEDIELLIKLFSEGYYIYGIEEPLYKRRMHDQQISRRMNENLKAWNQILLKHGDNLSPKEKIQWEKTVSWGCNKLDQTKLASRSVQNSIELLGNNIGNLETEYTNSLFNSILHQCRILDDKKLTISCLGSLETILDENKKMFHRIDILYANLGLEYAGLGRCQKCRRYLAKSIRKSPRGIYKYYFYLWVLGGKRGYLTGRKLESRLKPRYSFQANEIYD